MVMIYHKLNNGILVNQQLLMIYKYFITNQNTNLILTMIYIYKKDIYTL